MAATDPHGAKRMTTFRRANATDATFLVPLFAESSGGVWPAVWKTCVTDGESAEEAAAKYLLDASNKLSLENTIVAELNGHRVGAMATYREVAVEPGRVDAIDERQMPADLAKALQPYRELSDPDSLFIAELCCLPTARGQGLGTRFLHHAKRDAGSRGLSRLTLRVFSENVGAVRLYERFGFRALDRRDVVPYPGFLVGGSVLLMSYAL